jgi:hypothetical protein
VFTSIVIDRGGPEVNAPAHPVGTAPHPFAAYRQLLMRGLAPSEAANVTAVMAGIRLADTPWTAREISHLLFLRALRESGRFGPEDGVA